MATIEFRDILTLESCLYNAQHSENIFNRRDIEDIKVLCAMLKVAGVIRLNNIDFELIGKYR